MSKKTVDVSDLTDADVAHIKAIYDSMSKIGRFSMYKQAALDRFMTDTADASGRRDFVAECWISSILAHMQAAGFKIELPKKDDTKS